MFLFEQNMLRKGNIDPRYVFMPYNFGPYSAMLQHDVNELVDDEYLELDVDVLDNDKYIYNYKLTEKGSNYIEELLNTQGELQAAHESLNTIKVEANEMDLDSLLRKVYAEYPEYARNSVYDL